MYDNIGGKIKGLAKTMFIVEAIGAVITGIVLLATDDVLIFAGLLTLFCGPIIAWVSSWVLYAFGELVEKTSDTNNVIRKIESYTRNLRITYQDEQATKETKNSKKNQEKPKPSSINDKLIANDLPIYTPNGSTPCDTTIHKKYKDNLGKNIGANSKDGHWEIESVLNERAFVCNHCHGIIAFETDFNNNQES